MKTPKKLYLVVSRKAHDRTSGNDVRLTHKEAKHYAAELNELKELNAEDWRVVTYSRDA